MMRTRKRRKNPTRAMLLALSIAAAGLLLYHVHPLVHALGKNEATLEIGAGEAKVKASLSEKGVLTISGTGRTRDYTADTAPFEEYADRIVSVKIEEGVTGIGDYLFYNCGNLKGSLTMPSTLIWIGAESFSGDSQETSPKFTSVISRFREAEIARLKPGAEIPETRETESGTEILATPGEAESKPEETSENGTGETLPTEGAESQSTEAGDHAGERPTTAGPDGTEPTTVEPSGTEPTTAGASGMEPTTAGAGSGTTTAGTSGSGSTTSGASGPESTTAGASGPEPTTAGPSGTEPTTAGPTGTEPTTAEPSAEPLAAAPDNQNSQTAEKAGTFIMASSRLSGPFRGFTLNDSETVVSESEAESEETSESETHDTGEAPQPSPEAPTETKAGSKPTASPSTPQSTESDEEDIEPTEEFSEDGLLSNNLYDGVIAAAEVKNSEREYYTFETITSQLIGDAVFYSGQKGAYDCEPENTSFADAAEQAGYRKADRFIQVEMEGIRASLPVVDGAFYAPEVPEGLNGPEDDDPVFISCFTGWTLERDWESMGESAPVYETGTAVPVSEDEELVSLYGNWEKTCSFVPEVRAEARDNLTVYSVVDANTEQPIPESGSYLIQYQWQICRPEPEAEPETADNESVTLNNDQTGPGMTTGAEENLTSPDMIAEEEPDIIGLGIPAENENLADETIPLTAHPENEESWEDIGEAVSAVYERQAETTDAKSYFRVVLSVEKVTYFRSASQPVIMVSDPVSGKAEAVKITVTLEAGGADGTAPAVEPVKDGLWLAPQANPFTRTDGQVFTGWQVSAAGAEALLKDGSSAVGNVILESDDLILSAASSAANPSVTLTAQWSADVCVIYVDSNGKDTNSGLSASEAVKTLSKAYEKLTKPSMAQNRIVLCGTYSTGAITLGGKPAVITGLNPENGSKGTFTLNGALSCGADTTFENMTINTAQSQKIFANCHKLIMGYGLTMSNGKPNIYGGGASDLTGDADIILCSGAYNTIAGSGSVHSITGNSNITVINAEMSSLYGGGSYESSPNPSNTVWVNGNAYIHFYGGTCTDSIFGGPRFGVLGGAVYMEIYGGDISTIVGGSHSGFAASVAGKINIAIHGGTIQTVYGGAYDGNKSNIDRSPCQDDVNILMDGGVIAGDLFCGSSGFYNVPQYISIRGNVEAEFTGGKIKGNLYGGSDLDKIQGNVTIRLAGVEVAGNVYGGGVGRKDYNGTLFYAYIGGNVTVDIESGTVIGGNVYGGSKDHGTIDGDVTINYNGSSLQEAGSSLYGGGYGTETTIKGSSRITVNSGAFIADSLYGCGEQGKVLGGSTVILNGGTIGNNVFAAGNDVGATATTLIVNGTTAVGNGIYGGSNHSETTNTAEITINSPIDTVIYGGGFGENTTVTNAAITIASGGDVKKSVFGGGNLGKVTNSEITVNGTVKDVYGGGNSAGVTGTIKVTVSEGAEAGNVYGGCNEVGTTANPQLTIAGKVTGSVYGGGQGINTSTAAPVVGLSGKGTIAGSLFGGGNAGIVTGGTTLNITGGHANLIFGGGDAREVTGGTAVSMTGGTAGSIYGGGNSAGVDGTVTINLGSGAEAANVYGGSNSQGTVVSPRITIEGKAGNVYASGQGSGTITKSPTVTLEKTASVTNLYGGGMEGDTQDGTTLILKNEDTPVQNVYGGGNKAGVTGTAAITQEANARAARIFGGSNSSGTVTVSTLTVNGQVGAEAAGTDAAGTEADGTTEEAQPTGVLYGAGYGDGTITGATNITVGATAIVHGDVFGGGEKGLVSGDTSVLLNSSAQLTGGLYGGGNEAIIKGSTHVQADKDSVVAGSVYGGGKGEDAVVNTNTRVIVSAHVTGNVFGGGAKGPVVGSTHVDIPQGLIDGEGNVFGGSDQALVSKNTQVHIGTEAADGNHIDITDDTSLLIHGTVFGGGNTTADGSSFDARHPFVEGSSEVSVTATGYGRDKFNIMTSIFGDGNKCVVAGSRTVILTDYHALGDLANASIQRADTLTLDQCEVELIGAVDSANLVPTIAYSLNRIDDLRLVGGSVLKLQSSVNLVRSLKSLDKSPEDGGTPVKTTSTTDLGVQPSTENKIYIQQGNQMELRTSEDITTTQYGKVSGYSLLFSYDINGAPIQSGVYVLGGYGETAAGGFLYGEAGADQYKMIDPRTDNQNWKNWALGTDMTKNGILVMSNKPAGRKIVQIESPWGADGSIYRPIEEPNEPAVEIVSTGGSTYTLQNPASIDGADSPDTMLGISVRTGSQGWMNQTEAGYLVGNSADSASWNIEEKKTMRTLNNQSIKPIIELELTNRLAITADDAEETYPLIVRFKMENIKVQSDGSEVRQGKLTIELKIRRESARTYEDILLAPGKEYVRGTQTYVFDGDKATAGGAGTTISKQSAVTVQYTRKSDSASTGPRSFRLKFYANATLDSMGEEVTLPEGVTIQAIDRTKEYPEYAYYKVPASGVNAVSLTDFTKNGTTDRYERTFGHTDPINYLFIIDFQNAPQFSQEKLCVAIEPVYDGGSVGEAGKAVFNVMTEPKAYGMSSSEATGEDDEGAYYERKAVIPASLRIWASGGTGIDTTGKNTEMGVGLKLKNRDTGIYIPIPTNWYVKNEETSYTVSGSDMIVPLSSGMAEMSTGLEIGMDESSLSAGKYQWELHLISSPLAEYPGKFTDTPQYINFNLTDKRYSIAVGYSDQSADRLYPSKQETAREPLHLQAKLQATGGAAADGVRLKVSLLKKDSDTKSYSAVSLDTLFTAVSGMNQYYDWAASQDITFGLNQTLPEGTYRLQFELVRGNNGTEQVVAYDTENFIVTP